MLPPSCVEGSRGTSVTTRRTPGGQILYGHRKVYSSCRLLLLSRFFVSRLRGFVCLTRVLEGGRRVLLACCMIALSMVLRGHTMSLGGIFMMLRCFVMRVFCHVDVLLESMFRLSKSQASYEPLDVIVRSSLPGRMAHSAITSPRVSLSRNPTEPLEPPVNQACRPLSPRPNAPDSGM